MKLDALTKFFIMMTVLGLGAIVEIVEYLVVRTVPGNGVGGYDNNMQDLAANLVGTVVSMATAGSTRLYAVTASSRRQWISPRHERMVSALELSAIGLIALSALWILPARLSPFAFAVLDIALLAAGVLYTVWISPTFVHGDTLESRGLGPMSQGFIRRDNLRVASRSFGLLGLAGTIVLLLLAEWINPGWLVRADWRSWMLRLTFYLGSASAQAIVVVGFVLVRVSRVVTGVAPGGGLGRGQRLAAAAITAMIFAILHAPDPLVVALTGAFGFATAWICLETPNVLPAALCQAVLGLIVHRGLGIALRVGYFHDHPGAYVFREAFPGIRTLIGNLW